MKKIKILLLSIFLIQIAKISPAAPLLTLKEAIQIGMENNMPLTVAQSAVARSEYKRTPKIFIPNLSIGLGNDFTHDSKAKNYRSSQVLNFSLPIDPIKKYYDYQKATAQLQLDRSLLDNAEIRYIYEIAKAYYTLVFEQQKLDMLSRSMKISQEHKEYIKRLYDLNRESKTKYTTALIQYNNDLFIYTQQEETVANAKATLCTAIGKKEDEDFTVGASINVNDISASIIFKDREYTCPEIYTKEKAINFAEIQKKIAWSKILPTIAASVNYKFDKKYDNWKDKISVGITVSMNIYDLITLSNEVQCANIDIDCATKDMAIKKNHIKIQTRFALEKYETKRLNYFLEKENLDLSNENFLELQQHYTLGKISYLEYKDAKKNMEIAELNFLRKAYEIKLAELDIYMLLGNKELLLQVC